MVEALMSKNVAFDWPSQQAMHLAMGMVDYASSTITLILATQCLLCRGLDPSPQWHCQGP